jgi:DNA-binding transcriptional LysR family regulator
MGKNIVYKGLQLSQLRNFCVVAQHGNFTAAAQVLGVSVPAVWQQVRALEREVATPLLRRNGRSVSLTAEGKLLFDLIQPHVNGLDSLVKQFQQRRGQIPQKLSVATTAYLASYHLAEPVREFVAAFPNARLGLVTGISAEPIEILARHQADLGVAAYELDEPRVATLEYEDLFPIDFTLLTTPDHPLSRKRKVTPQDLVRYPLIVPPARSYAYRMTERLFRRHGLIDRMEIVMECRSTDLILNYVSLGLGIAVIFLGESVRRSLKNLHTHVLDARLPRLNVAILTRKHFHLSGPGEAFRDLLRKHLRDPAFLTSS